MVLVAPATKPNGKLPQLEVVVSACLQINSMPTGFEEKKYLGHEKPPMLENWTSTKGFFATFRSLWAFWTTPEHVSVGPLPVPAYPGWAKLSVLLSQA